MKIPKIIQLPSGSWFCQIRIDGQSVSITDDDRDTVEAKAYAYKAGVLKIKKTPERITLGQAMDRYIEDRENILSPSTVREYKRVRRNELQLIGDRMVDTITTAHLQRYINRVAKDHSPKTVRNNYCFIVAVIKYIIPDANYYCILPQRKKPLTYAPSEDDIIRLIAAVRGTELEVAVLLSAFGSLRRSEICALTVEDIRPNGVYINKAMVLNDKREYVVKRTKTTESERLAELPADVIDRIREICPKGRLYHSSPNTITKNFFNVLQRNNIQHFRFHDLRHYWVSVAHAMGMPDFYLMKNGGWATMDTPRRVYMNDMTDMVKPQESAVLTRFSEQFKKANC